MSNPELDEPVVELLEKARAAWRAGDSESAVSRAVDVSAHVRATRGGDSEDAAHLLNYLGLIAKRNGIYPVAEVLYEEALRIRTKLFEPPSAAVAASLTNLGRLYEPMGKQARAKSLLRQATDMLREARGEAHPEYATALNNLGLLLLRAGRLDGARANLARALRIREAHAHESPLKLAQALHNLALCNHELGNYKTAEPLYTRALEVRQLHTGPEDGVVALYLASLGRFYRSLANYDAAAEHYSRAEAIYRRLENPDKSEFASCLHNFGVLYHFRGLHREAWRYLNEALQLRRRLPGHTGEVASTMLSLAEVAHAERQYTASESLYRRVLAIYEEQLGKRHHRCADVHTSLGGLSFDQGAYQQAKEHFETAHQVRVEAFGEQHEKVATSLDALASLHGAMKRCDEAIDAVLRSAEIRDVLIDQVITLVSERERQMYLDQLRSNTDILMSLLIASPRSGVELSRAFNYILRRKGLGFEASAAQQAAIRRRPDLEKDEDYAAWVAVTHELKRLAVSGPDGRGPQKHSDLLRELRERRDELERSLAKSMPELVLAQMLRGITLEAVLSSSRLCSDAVLVEIVQYQKVDFTADTLQGEKRFGEPSYGAFVAKAREPDSLILVDLGDSASIDESVQRFRRTVVSNLARGKRYRDAPAEHLGSPPDTGEGLTKGVFERLRPHFGDRKRIIVCPDGEVTQLPLQALPTGGRSRIIDEYTISYLNTLRDLIRPDATGAAETRSSLVVAAPDYDLSRSETDADSADRADVGEQSRDIHRAGFPFEKLDGMRAEGDEIAEVLHVSALSGKKALEHTIKERCPPDVFHIASHGFFLENLEEAPKGLFQGESQNADRLAHLAQLEDPLLRAGLVVAGANTWFRRGKLPEEAEDGVLNGRDVATLNLVGTELVVLSACNTGIGEVRSGQGVFGLRSAFKLAGTRTLVMSLWKVPDDETHHLMVEFYRQLANQKSPAEALREAQREMKKINPNPFFWGAFICEGDDAPISALARRAQEPPESALPR